MRADVRAKSACARSDLQRGPAGPTITRSRRKRSRRFASSITICCGRIPPYQGRGGSGVIEMRRAQLSFGDGLIAAEVSDLHEDWMKQADRVLDDENIVAVVYEDLAWLLPDR